MSDSNNLKLRVRLPSQEEIIPQEEVIYHWDRIIGAAAACMLAVAVLVGGSVYYFTKESSVEQSLETGSTPEQSKQLALSQATPEQKSPETIANKNVLTNEVVSEESDSAEKSKTSALAQTTTDQSKSAPSVPNVTENKVDVANAPDTKKSTTAIPEVVKSDLSAKSNLKSDPITPSQKAVTEKALTQKAIQENINNNEPTAAGKPLTKLTSQAAALPTAQTVNEATVTKTNAVTDGSGIQSEQSFTKTKAAIFSDNIKRFVISQNVNDNEPVGSLDQIEFNANDVATIYAFSDAVNLKDDKLFYRWTYNGKVISTVKIGVWANRWRSYSSKLIQPHMRGNWTVELMNDKGETLAMSQFEYK